MADNEKDLKDNKIEAKAPEKVPEKVPEKAPEKAKEPEKKLTPLQAKINQVEGLVADMDRDLSGLGTAGKAVLAVHKEYLAFLKSL